MLYTYTKAGFIVSALLTASATRSPQVTEEVFQNEDIYIYEEIANDKMIPLPYLKVATSLPAGLNFRITEFDKKTKTPP